MWFDTSNVGSNWAESSGTGNFVALGFDEYLWTLGTTNVTGGYNVAGTPTGQAGPVAWAAHGPTN